MPLIEGLIPIPDSQIKASSSHSSRNGPNSARMITEASAKGGSVKGGAVKGGSTKRGYGATWTAAKSDPNQFIEVDMGDVRAIYGVITEGKAEPQEWVTSYQILYSTDGSSYSYYQDQDDNTKIFSGNFDGSTKVQHLFSRPFEARLIRLEPLTWEGRISLRFELLGCAEAIAGSTLEPLPFTTIVQPTVAPQKACRDPMGLENGFVSASQLSASSFYNWTMAPDQARFGSDSVWAALTLDDRQYMQIDFIDARNITGVVTKGREDLPQWVTSYRLAYSSDGYEWSRLVDGNGEIREFPGNFDQQSEVTNMLDTPLRTRFLRILPTKWKNWIALQVQVLGCFESIPCRDEMGVENGLITHHQLSASSEYNGELSASNGRLSSKKAWSAAVLNRNQYIQVDFLQPTNISGVVTRGRADAHEWVKSFEIALSDDAVAWRTVDNDRGKAQEYLANVDQHSAVINLLPTEVSSRYIRIKPLSWKTRISMRFEILGCFQDIVCSEPMGLENGMLSDGQISASTSSDIHSTPEHVRINDEFGWSPNAFDTWPYLQIDLLELRNISSVVSKGKGNEDSWVTEYKVLYSSDGERFSPVTSGLNQIKIFRGNFDRNTPVVNPLPEIVLARYFRIIPLDFKNAIGLRLELLGCYHPYVCQEPMGMETGAISDFQLSSSSFLNAATAPHNARIDSDTSWAASELNQEQYIQVDLMTITNVTGLTTRGRNDAYEWVTAYSVAVSDDAITWHDVREETTDDILVFKANDDTDSPVTNLFPKAVSSRFLRLKPETWNRRISLRFEVLGCTHEQTACMEPMGLENGLLADSQLTASSSAYDSSSPFKARLSSESSWTAGIIDSRQFLQIDFGAPRNINAVVTKGDPARDQWVSSYKIVFSDDETKWFPIKDKYHQDIEFSGNFDRTSPVVNILPETVETQFIRILPTDWKNWISLRTEILGCYHPYEAEEPKPTEKVLDFTFVPTQPPMMFLCPEPMEKEMDLLPSARIEASSAAPDSHPELIRLNTPSRSGKSGGWVPGVGDLHPVVVAEFPEVSWLTAVHIQGREDAENWVKTLRIIASKDNQTWTPVFGPDGKEIIEGNSNQNDIVGHYFKKPMAAKFVKIIPESWHKWPSFRIGLRGCHHPEETVEVTTVPPKVDLCPELPADFETRCPASCAAGFFCDGERCVDPTDCTCFYNGRSYQVGDKIEGDKCSHCLCTFGGHSICTRKTCPPCNKEELSVLSEDCECVCEKCGEGQVLCRSNKVCLPSERWCDGVTDCPDDELHCEEIGLPIFIPQKLETTESPYFAYTEKARGMVFTEKPLSFVTPEFIPKPIHEENATCDIRGKHIKTLDGQEVNYDICHHVALKDIISETFTITVHKECDYNQDCSHWIEVLLEGQRVKVTSDLKVELDGHPYTASQLVLLNKKPSANITVEKVGDQVTVKLLSKGVTLTYDARSQLSIEVSHTLLKSVSGLCGFYSGSPDDDRQKPDGSRAYTSQEFGDSWAIGGVGKECAPVICPHQTMLRALQHCAKLRDEPFTKCGAVLAVEQFVELCMSSVCECLHERRKGGSEEKCQCDALQTYVQACEAKLGPAAVRNWRMWHKCVPECPAGMEWSDCGPSCQLTCDSTDFEECHGRCVAGCFCPAGTILDGDLCIPPDHCADKVCQGFGDPHLQTFDGLFFPFQAIGTFLISSDSENSFVVEGLTRKCHFFSSTTCLVGLEITYKGQHIYIKKGHDVKVNGEEIGMERLPVHSGGVVVVGYPVRTFVVAIPQLSVEARYYEENAGFAVKVPSRRYFNNTIGLCGNCNGKKDDELNGEPVSEFVCSWMQEGSKEDCKQSFVDLPELSDRVALCQQLQEPQFGACHPLVDVEIFVDACSFDATHSADAKRSFCKTAMEYSRQCCQAGIVMDGWTQSDDCDFGCPDGLQFHPCYGGCPQTCQNTKNKTDVSVCENIKVDGCFCPEKKIWKDDSCVDAVSCETCDAEGHTAGDVWSEGDCKKCRCGERLTKECVVEVCPAKPICSSHETSMKVESESEASCCETYTCVEKPKKGCPSLEIPTCAEGESVKLQVSKSVCPKYGCECDRSLCAPVVWPQDLEGGQVAESVFRGCCPAIRIFCDAGACPEKPTCADGLQVVGTEGECCTLYKCKPPKDVCIYTHQYKVSEGFEVAIEPDDTETTTYKPHDVWQDGLCENCSCVENHGQLVPFCVKEQCILLENMPENKNYELHEFKMPDKCCPDIFQVMCKDDDGNLYGVGEEWQDNDNPCITYLCEQTTLGDVQKVKNVINCTKCSRASEFIPPSKKLGQCCGICRPSKCEEGDSLHEVGDTWTPEGEACLVAQCVREGGTLRTIYTKQPCPLVPKECPKDKIIRDESKCCEICNLTSEMSCNSAPVPLEDTVGYFKDYANGDLCVNSNPVPNVLKCSGACHSNSYYSLEDGNFKGTCKCCKVNVTVERTIELKCPDRSMRRKFQLPETCQCSKCAPEEATKKPWAKPERIKGGFHTQRFGQEPITHDSDTFQQEPVGLHEFGQEPESHSFQQEPIGFQKFGQEPDSVIFQQEPIGFGKFGQESQSHTFQQEPIGFEKFGHEPESDHFRQEPVGFDETGQEPVGHTFMQERNRPEKLQEKSESDSLQQELFGHETFGQEPESDTFQQQQTEFDRIRQEPNENAFGEEPEKFGQELDSNNNFQQEHTGFERFGQEAESDTFQQEHEFERLRQEPESHSFQQQQKNEEHF